MATIKDTEGQGLTRGQSPEVGHHIVTRKDVEGQSLTRSQDPEVGHHMTTRKGVESQGPWKGHVSIERDLDPVLDQTPEKVGLVADIVQDQGFPQVVHSQGVAHAQLPVTEYGGPEKGITAIGRKRRKGAVIQVTVGTANAIITSQRRNIIITFTTNYVGICLRRTETARKWNFKMMPLERYKCRTCVKES